MLNLLVGLGIGVVLGAVIGWLIGVRKTAGAKTDLQPLVDELRNRIGHTESELAGIRAQLSDEKSKAAGAFAERDAARQLIETQRELNEKALREGREAQQKASNDLREAFRALSAEALQKTQPEFLRLANETLAKFQESAKGDLKERQQAIATLVEPLKHHLETYQKRLQQSETAQSTTLGEVRKQLETLALQSQ